MNKRIKKKWLKALRSGEYKQIEGALRVNSVDDKGRSFTGFCCLGVLCNIHAQENPEIARNEVDSYMYMGEIGVLPQEVQTWAQMDSDDGYFETKKGEPKTLAELNDNRKTFKQIANYIERFF